MLKSAKFVKAIIELFKKLIKKSGSRITKIEKNILIISIIANIANVAEKTKIKKSILYTIIKLIYYFA